MPIRIIKVRAASLNEKLMRYLCPQSASSQLLPRFDDIRMFVFIGTGNSVAVHFPVDQNLRCVHPDQKKFVSFRIYNGCAPHRQMLKNKTRLTH